MADGGAPQAAEASVAHDSPGRLRLKVPERRGDLAFFARLGAALAEAPGVRAVETNARTGSLLILHDGAHRPPLEWAAGQGLLRPAERPFSPVPARPEREPDWRTVAAVLVGLLALLQLLRGQALGPATTLAFMAAQIARLPLAVGDDTPDAD
jgi:hypothetical protein